MTATQTVNGGDGAPDPDIVRRFHFTRDMVKGPVYRKYKFAINRLWNVDDLDFTQDAKDWKRIDDAQREGLLGVTVRFLAGEQAVTDELVPMIAASHALGRFDWVTYLSTFLMEEAKHAEFFMRWHDEVVGVLEPDEVAAHFLVRVATVDPTGRFRGPGSAPRGACRSTASLLMAAIRAATPRHRGAFVRFSAAYNAFVEGVLTMPSYEIVIDTTRLGRVPGAARGLPPDPARRGPPHHLRHGACRTLIEKNPDLRRWSTPSSTRIAATSSAWSSTRGRSRARAQKYQDQKVRHYRNRCREMGITPDETLIDQILDPEIDFVVGHQAG